MTMKLINPLYLQHNISRKLSFSIFSNPKEQILCLEYIIQLSD